MGEKPTEGPWGRRKDTPVIEMLKREGRVYTRVIKDCSKEELMPLIWGKILKKAPITQMIGDRMTD